MNPSICPQCQSPIPPDAPAGLCPSCLLLGAAIATEPAPAGMAHAPSIEAIRAAFPELDILEMFGHGGMGVVFKARQPRLDRLVALKILPPALAKQPGFSERFSREARALARLSHPNIVTVFDFGERAGFYYLLMEFVNGVNLRQAIRAGVKPEQALTLVPKICEALQFAHDHGVLHRDIKPENILLDVSGVPKLADFGIAKLAGEPGSTPDLTLTGASLGTAAYMAPEQIEHPGEVDHRADIYSLGVVLYEMLTGELPLGRFAAPSEKANVTRGVDEVVFRALEKQKERRQQTATEMKTDVEGVQNTTPPAPISSNAAPAPADESEDHYERSPLSQLLLFCTVLCAVAIPLPAVSPSVREFISPATLAIITGIFGALLGIVPHGKWRRVAKAAERKAITASAYTAYKDDEWIVRCPACGNSRSLTSLGGVRIGAASIGKRTFSTCSQCGFRGMVDILLARDAKAQNFIPDPIAAREGGKSLALWGAWLNAVPLVLGVCFIPLWLTLYDLHEAHARFPQALRPHLPALLGYTIPSGVAVIVGFVFTVIVLLGFRYRARWFFWWLMVYGVVFCFTIVAPLLALFALFNARDFFADPLSAPRAQRDPSVNPWPKRTFWLIICLVVLPLLLIATGLILPMTTRGTRPSPQPGSYQVAQAGSVVSADRPPFIGRLGGADVELVAVSHHPSTDLPWWGMDGMAPKEGPFLNHGSRVFAEAGTRAFDFVFKTGNLPAGASAPYWEVENYRFSSSGGAPSLVAKPQERLSGYVAFTASLPEAVDRANIKIGLAYEPWQTVSENAVGNALGITREYEGVAWRITHGPGIETKNNELMVTFSNNRAPGFEVRVVAVKQDGTEVSTTREDRINEQSTWYFRDLPIAEVKTFRFQVRWIRWVEFRGISLTPLERVRTPASPSNATNALYEEGIQIASKRLAEMRARHESGLASPFDLIVPERDLEIAEARGNPLLIAHAKEKYAAKKLSLMQVRVEAGVATQEELRAAQTELNQAKLEVEAVTKKNR